MHVLVSNVRERAEFSAVCGCFWKWATPDTGEIANACVPQEKYRTNYSSTTNLSRDSFTQNDSKLHDALPNQQIIRQSNTLLMNTKNTTPEAWAAAGSFVNY